MAILTRYSAKFYRDSTETCYAVFISASENTISKIEIPSEKDYSVQIKTLPDGGKEHTLTFLKSVLQEKQFTCYLTFEGGQSDRAAVILPSATQKLVVPNDSLTFSTTFSNFEASSASYSISDAIYYSKSPYSTLYVFPTSSINYLDTSSSKDSYYVTGGSAAYIASNDLQNSFLNSISYSVSGVDSNQLGKFIAGNGPQRLNFSQYTNINQEGPVVHGFTFLDSDNIPSGGTVYNVSKNPASSNYYLNGCTDKKQPCIASGTSFSTDCITGSTFTAAILNNISNIFHDGKCSGSCDGYSLEIRQTKLATTLISADGVFEVVVKKGTANYTYSLTQSRIGVGLSYTTVTGTSSSDTIVFSSLYAGSYTLIITDASSPTCSLTQLVSIEADSAVSTRKGCATAAAINFNSSVTAPYAWKDVCVFCDSTGKLIKGSDDKDGTVVGEFSSVRSFVSHATSKSNTGVSNDDGKVVLSSLKLNNYEIGDYKDPYSQETVVINFNGGDYFTGGTDYEYKLYSLRDKLGSEYNDSSYLVANGDLVSTTSNVSGGLMSFGSLPASDYAVHISYTKDGESKEYEDCYIVEQFSVLQNGCTDIHAANYNSHAHVNDGSCQSTPDDPGEDCNLVLGQYLQFECYGSTNGGPLQYGITLNISHNLIPSSNALVLESGITDPYGNTANPAHCYYVVVVHYITGENVTIQGPEYNFHKLWTGTPIAEFDCDSTKGTLSDIEKIQVYFSHGGAWAPYWPGDTDYPVYVDGIANGQGNCGYSEFSYVSPFLDSVDNCCIVDEPPVVGCMDSNATNYSEEATIPCKDCCVYPDVFGCTDMSANNYNPSATVDDESCTYDVLGCMDPEAENYDANATISDGSCVFPATPCSIVEEVFESNTDLNLYAAATNTTSTYDIQGQVCLPNSDGKVTVSLPSALIQAAGVNIAYWTAAFGNVSSALYYGINWEGTVDAYTALNNMQNASLLISDGELLSIGAQYEFTNLPSGVYTLILGVHTNISSDGLSVITNGDSLSNWFCATPQYNVPVQADGCEGQDTFIMGCTDPNADNYDATATDDDGTCLYPNNAGCTDIFAVNYNSNVTIDDGSCNYEGNACAPPVAGVCTPNTYTTNSADSVSSCCIPTDISDRLDAIEKCLANSGSRFYNKMITGLSDSCSTMDAWKMMIILEILRQKGLPCVYNCSDAATQSLTGTTCNSVWVTQGSPIWSSSATYQIGHVVKSAVDISAGNLNSYYVATSSEGLGQSPNTTVSNGDNPTSGWQRCCDEVTYSSNINYLTNFIGFAEQYCKDCELPSQLQETPITTQVASKLSVGGIDITNNGGSFDAS